MIMNYYMFLCKNSNKLLVKICLVAEITILLQSSIG